MPLSRADAVRAFHLIIRLRVHASPMLYNQLSGLLSAVDTHLSVLAAGVAESRPTTWPRRGHVFVVRVTGQGIRLGRGELARGGGRTMVIIVTAIDGTHADHQGLQPGDEVIEINGQLLRNASLERAK